MNFPIGLSLVEIIFKSDILSTLIFASAQIISPAGTATATALKRTSKILSLIVEIITFLNKKFSAASKQRTAEIVFFISKKYFYPRFTLPLWDLL